MSDRITVPEKNLRNIPIFPNDPSDDRDVITEIKQHIFLTAEPHTWRGHSHTKPSKGAPVVYVEEFDVPARDNIRRVAPCPCCMPFHPKYKNKGKIAWFPEESVIRLIGPDCFAAINNTGHAEAIIELRKRQKRQVELSTIALHAQTVEALIEALDEALAISLDLDAFMHEFNRVIDNELRLNLWREVKGGNLSTIETRRVPFQKADGTVGERNEEFRATFLRIQGYSMIDRSGQASESKIKTLRSGLSGCVETLKKVGKPDNLSDGERQRIADAFPKARTQATRIFAGMSDRQLFLKSGAIESLSQWGKHPKAPIPFTITDRKYEVILSASSRSLAPTNVYKVPIRNNALKPIPKVPVL